MVQENFKKVEKANWLKIIFNSARFLISLLVLNIGVVLLFTVEISRNFYVSTVVIFIVLCLTPIRKCVQKDSLNLVHA